MWFALGLLIIAIVCIVQSALSTASKWDDIECYEEDDD